MTHPASAAAGRRQARSSLLVNGLFEGREQVEGLPAGEGRYLVSGPEPLGRRRSPLWRGRPPEAGPHLTAAYAVSVPVPEGMTPICTASSMRS